MLLRYYLSDFEMVPFAPIITGITLVVVVAAAAAAAAAPAAAAVGGRRAEFV